MAVCAHELAACDLRLDALEAIALSDEPADILLLGSHVVELEHRWIREAAVRAPAVQEEVHDVRPGPCPSSVEGPLALAPMEIPAHTHVLLAALLAP